MDKNAIIVVYKGEEPSLDCIRTVGEAVMRRTSCKPETVEVHTLNEKEIANALIAKALGTERHAIDEEYTPEEAAVIYIRTLFPGKALEDTLQFSAKLSARYALAVLQNNDEKLVNAVRAIGRGSFDKIRITIRHEYGFGSAEYSIVKNIYDSCAGHFAG